MGKRLRVSTILIGTSLVGGSVTLALTGTAGAADPPAGSSNVPPPAVSVAAGQTPSAEPATPDAVASPGAVVVPMAAPLFGQPADVVLSPEALASNRESAMQAVLIARPDGASIIAGSAPIYVELPVAPAVPAGPSDAALAALRACEAHGNYAAVSAGGLYRGAYQFSQSTWNSVASRWAPRLVGVDPATATPAEQDAMARALFAERGWAPWPTCGAGL